MRRRIPDVDDGPMTATRNGGVRIQFDRAAGPRDPSPSARLGSDSTAAAQVSRRVEDFQSWRDDYSAELAKCAPTPRAHAPQSGCRSRCLAPMPLSFLRGVAAQRILPSLSRAALC